MTKVDDNQEGRDVRENKKVVHKITTGIFMQRIKNRRYTRWQTSDENKVRNRAFRLLHERITAFHTVFVLAWK